MFKKFMAYGLPVLAVGALSAPAAGQTIMSPAVQVDPGTSTVASGSSTYTLPQITDGITSDAPNYNGFQGQHYITGNWSGDISLNLNAVYDIDRFHIWNDINVRAEGLRNFTLRFYDAADDQIGSQSFTGAQSVDAMQTFQLSSTISGVKRVVLQVDSVARENSIARVEIREVAFSGVKSAPKSASLDNYMCYDLLAHETSPSFVRKGEARSKTFQLTDQFGRTQARIGHAVSVCNPVGVNDRKGDPREYHRKYKDHLVCYQLMANRNDRGNPNNVRIDNSLFGGSFVTMADRDTLCVKSTKQLDSEVKGRGAAAVSNNRDRKRRQVPTQRR